MTHTDTLYGGFFFNVLAGILCRFHYGDVVTDIRFAAKHVHVLCKFITGTS